VPRRVSHVHRAARRRSGARAAQAARPLPPALLGRRRRGAGPPGSGQVSRRRRVGTGPRRVLTRPRRRRLILATAAADYGDQLTTGGSAMITRREFVKATAAAGGALGVSARFASALDAAPTALEHRPVERAAAPLNILILGGTGFTGPEQVEYAIARGHRVTLFNRGKTRPGLFKGKVAEELIGDLNSDTSALKDKQFDVVIDNPTTLPFWVKNAAQYLKGNTKHYMFISTTSVYRDESEIGTNGESPTLPMPAGLDPYQPDQRNDAQLAASANPQYYGPFKARAEVEVQNQYPGINTIIRPCLIVGPLDR